MLYQYILLVAVVIVPSSSLSTIGSQGATTARPRFFDGLVWRVYLPNSGHPVVQLVVNFILGAVIRSTSVRQVAPLVLVRGRMAFSW